MKVILVKKYSPKDAKPTYLLKGGVDVEPNNKRAEYIIGNMNLYIQDNIVKYPVIFGKLTSLTIISNLDNFVGRDLKPNERVIVYDVIVNGMSLFDIGYVHYVRFVGILNRNYMYSSMSTEISTVNFWSPDSDYVRSITHEKYPDGNELESGMRMFERISHIKAVQLWSVTHGLEYYVTPYEYNKETDELTISKEDNLSIRFGLLMHNYAMIEV